MTGPTPLLLTTLLAAYLAALLAAPIAGAQAPSADRPRLYETMVRHVEALEDALIAFRHDLHRHPELSGAEARTAGRVADRLAELGFEVRTDVGGHGVVGVLQGGRPGPVVAFRADMDAVRSSDPDPVPYRSVVPGIRHICGHDVHTTIGIGLAEAFAAARDDLAGTVVLLFQPAEERGIGANAMLADGAFDAVTPDAIFAVHTAPYEVGTVATVAGGMMAGRASVAVTLRGTGDLAGAVEAVRQALSDVGTLSPNQAGQVAPPGFILVQLFGGAAGADASGEAVVRGQVMTAGPEDRARAKSAVTDALAALDLPGVALDVAYDERFMEGVTNDAALVALANDGIRALAPDVEIATVRGAVPVFSEDFGSFQARVPGVMYFLGVSNPEAGTVGMPHSPNYVADDAAILVGTRAMLAAMLARFLEG